MKVVGEIPVTVIGIETFSGISDGPSGQATAISRAYYEPVENNVWKWLRNKDENCPWWLFFHLNPTANGKFEVTTRPGGYGSHIKYSYNDPGAVWGNFNDSGTASVSFSSPLNESILAFVDSDNDNIKGINEQYLSISACRVRVNISRITVRDLFPTSSSGSYSQSPAYCPVPGYVSIQFQVNPSIPTSCTTVATLHRDGTSVGSASKDWIKEITGGGLGDLIVSAPGRYALSLRFIFSEGGSSFLIFAPNWDLYALKLDLEIPGVSEDQEEEPGGYLGMNEDDDDGGGTPDLDEPNGTGAADDDLAEVKVKTGLGGATLPKEDAKIEWYAVGMNQVRLFRQRNKAGGPMGFDSNTVKLSGQDVPFWIEAREPSSSMREVHIVASYVPVPGGYLFEDRVNFTIVHVTIAVGDTSDDADDVVAVGAKRTIRLSFSPWSMLLHPNQGPVGVDLFTAPQGASPGSLFPQFFDDRLIPKTFFVFTADRPSTTVYAWGLQPSTALNDLYIRARWFTVPPAPYTPPKTIDVGVEDVTVAQFRLKSVGFSGAGYRSLFKDDGTGVFTDDPSTNPHWRDVNLDGDADDQGDSKFPICFVRASLMAATVKIDMKPQIPLQLGLWISGKGPEGEPLNFDIGLAHQTGNELTAGPAYEILPLKNEIDIYDPMSISWKLSFGGLTDPAEIGQSSNPLYIILGALVPSVDRFHTLIRIGCKKAEGLVDPEKIVNKIWEEFEDREVRRADDGKQLEYWGIRATAWTPSVPPVPSNLWPFQTKGLLKEGDGRCGGWAEFFKDCLEVQGISSTVKGIAAKDLSDYVPYVDPRNPLIPGTRIYVKHWDWGSPPTNLGSIDAQGNINPNSVFTEHAVVIRENVIYDPSYGGKTWSSLKKWEEGSLDGYRYEKSSTGAFVYPENTNAEETRWLR